MKAGGYEPDPVERTAYDALQCYTLTRGDPDFVHQYVVDAWTAQHAEEGMKPIGLAFALIGLLLHLERGMTGREVQRAHMFLARQPRAWPTFDLPHDRGSGTAVHVMSAPEGPERDMAINTWCASVWKAFEANHLAVLELLERAGYGVTRARSE